jgi:ankyrin repeat protein
MNGAMTGRRWWRMTTRAWCAALVACLAAGSAAAQTSDFWYSIPDAAEHNGTDRVLELLLRNSSDPDGVGADSGRTGLDFAASFDNLAMAKELLEHGAHVDARDPVGNTALHWAAERSSMTVMHYLLAHKAAVDATNRRGETPLMVAAGQDQPAAVRLLLDSGADPKKQDFTGRDALGWAAGHPAALQALQARR